LEGRLEPLCEFSCYLDYMSSVQHLSDKVFYLPGGVNCAIVKAQDNKAILVDTGQDKDYGRDIKKACESLGLTPAVIINTHSHADHYGGNDYLLRQYPSVPVYAPAFESAILQTPYLEPVYLFNGARPLPELLSKWLLAKPSKVDVELKAGTLELHGVKLEVIDTSGHAHVQMSVQVDDVLIAADALFGSSVLEKYPLPFGQDIGNQIKSAARLKELTIKTVLPGHGEPSNDVGKLIEENLAAFERAAKVIEDSCTNVSTESVLQAACKTLNITMTDLPRYYLNLCVVTAYLSYLREVKRVEVRLEENQVLWNKS
jgi:glyoxylase-like metal-dependent hydrolase (beta-lactamase superfamily II)